MMYFAHSQFVWPAQTLYLRVFYQFEHRGMAQAPALQTKKVKRPETCFVAGLGSGLVTGVASKFAGQL